MKKKTYLKPSLQMALMDTEQIIANTPMTSGLQNGDGSNGDYGLGEDDDGGGGGGLNWGDAKGQVDWDDMW